MIERTTVRLPGELLKRARRKAADEGRTLTALIEDGLRLVVATDRRRTATSRDPIPVSAATGGLVPGIDLGTMSKLQEMEDLDDAARIKRAG